jgi:hypothetical protein
MNPLLTEPSLGNEVETLAARPHVTMRKKEANSNEGLGPVREEEEF